MDNGNREAFESDIEQIIHASKVNQAASALKFIGQILEIPAEGVPHMKPLKKIEMIGMCLKYLDTH